MGGESKSDSVKVAIRLRPLSKKELGNNEVSCVEMVSSDGDQAGSVTINDPEGKERPAQFAFDIVFDLDTQQTNVFQQVGRPAVEQNLDGFNGTIFAYGQTGSGKSWSMTGAEGDLRGIIPRVNETIFERIQEIQAETPTRVFLVQCSFFEIYNEIIFDLLNPSQDKAKLGAGLQIKEHPVLGIYVKDLSEIVVSDCGRLENLMTNGIKNRAVSSTQMNSVSSRSHSIFTIKINQKDESDKSRNVFAKLNLVDLAGSERQKGTGATGQTLKEGANINKSLSALGNVINALVENANGKKVFVPFRNSKLTRVLQESLGGNSLCTMLAALSPAACNYEETVSTLRYANRAKAIKISATKNEEASQISRLNAEIAELKKKLVADGGAGQSSGLMADEERKEIEDRYRAQLADMQTMLNSNWEEKQSMSRIHEAQVTKALDEQKQHAKAMEKECRKRFRLLKDQGDLELTIKGLADAVKALPPDVMERAVDCEWQSLIAGDDQRRWLRIASSVTEKLSTLQQQQTMAKVFQNAFIEDLKLWVEGEEASDLGMARTGARRAIAKMETLGREFVKLDRVETEGKTLTHEFAMTVQQVREMWTTQGASAVLQSCRPGDDEETVPIVSDNSAPNLNTITIEDIGRLLELIEIQANSKAVGFTELAAIEVSDCAHLMLRGMSWSPEDAVPANDMALLRSIAPPSHADNGVNEASGSVPAQVAACPREERSLCDWTPADVDCSVDGTECVLLKLDVPLDSLNKKQKTYKELLARPPPKFVHDVALLIRGVTGFLPQMTEEWPEPRDERIELLQVIADSTAATLALDTIVFDPNDVLKGKEVENTLRLLQLLAVAAAKAAGALRNANGDVCNNSTSGGDGRAGAVDVQGGSAEASQKRCAGEMPELLLAFERCVQVAIEHQDRLKDQHAETGMASPTEQLESGLGKLQKRFEEEQAKRLEFEEKAQRIEQELKESQNILKEQMHLLDSGRSASENMVAQKEALRNQVVTLRDGLLHRVQSVAARNSDVAVLKDELEQKNDDLKVSFQARRELEDEVNQLQRELQQADSVNESLAHKITLMKERSAGGDIDDILLLRQLQVNASEEKLDNLREEEDHLRQQEAQLVDANKIAYANLDEVKMQLQVIIEERDGYQVGVDQLWQEKNLVTEELYCVSQGYTHLSDRVADKVEEVMELQMELQKYTDLFDMLQANYERTKNSPVPKQDSLSPSSRRTAPSPPPEAKAVPAPLRQKSTSGLSNGQGSSHYSDEEFETPDVDD